MLPCAVPPPAVFNLHGKEKFRFPSSLPSNQMLLFCFSFSLMKLFSFWFYISKHRSDDDYISVGCGPGLHVSWAEARSPGLYLRGF